MECSRTVPAHGTAAFSFAPPHEFAQCVGLSVASSPALLVASITIAGVEQLLGEGLPAEFLATAPLQLDRQRATDELCVTLQNDGDADTVAVVTVEFVPVEAMMLSKGTLH